MPESGKSWLRVRWRTLFLLVIATIVGWSAYSYWQEYREQAAKRARELMAPSVGKTCWVIFRNAESGIDRAKYGPASIEGTENSVRGTFVKLNDEWIVLRAPSNEQLWIPREHVLLMRVE
ncbi:MAG: hypothetical protein AAGD11_01755 [Planctomycetota bacterium]